jgi:hypothetical protein
VVSTLSSGATLHIKECDIGRLPSGLRQFVRRFFRATVHEGETVLTAMLLPCGMNIGGVNQGLVSWRWLQNVAYRDGLPKGTSPEDYILSSRLFVIIALHHQETAVS